MKKIARAFKFTILFTLPLLGAIALAENIGGAGGSSSGAYQGSGADPVMSKQEMGCLLQQVGINPGMAEKTSDALFRALTTMQLDTAKFSRVSMMHFLAQIKAESAAGGAMTESGGGANKGYGYIQVTGTGNLSQAESCMNQVSSGLGAGVTSNPESTIGNGGDPYKSAVASLCWWKKSIMGNNENDQISLDPSQPSDQKITEIVNTGHIGGQVTGGIQNISLREGTFMKLQSADSQCRMISI